MADDEINSGLLQPAQPENASSGYAAMEDSVISRVRESLGLSFPSAVDPTVQIPDTDFDDQARQVTENFKAQEAKRAAVFHRDVVPTPDPDSGVDSLSITRNAFNFMFHDPAALLGVTWDREGVHASLDTIRDMVSEHPYRSGLAAATTIAPAIAGAYRLTKAGALAEIGADDLVMAGLVDDASTYAKMTPSAKTLIQGQAKQIGKLKALRSAVADGSASATDRAQLHFYEAFGNSYLDAHTNAELNPVGHIAEWREKTKNLASGKPVNDLLELAANVKKEEGTMILHALKDPAKLSELTPAAREFTLSFTPEARAEQASMLDSGFLDEETYKKVGDIWFSTLRKDSSLFNEGADTGRLSLVRRNSAESAADKGRLQVINIPRTASPHMLNRSLDEAGVTSLIKRQRAAEALGKGKGDAALKLLDHPDDAPAVELIKSGRHDEAAKTLENMSGGFIESDPQELVVRSLLQQKLLHLNYKTLRDVAMNPAVSKTREEVEAMTPAMRKFMVPLDRMENANVLRRMVGKAQGKIGAGDLGYVHSSIFNELGGVIKKDVSSGAVDWLKALTAIHKTAKTALNPFSHGQNTMGNGVFLSMAGFHPWEPENFKLLRKGWTTIGEWHNARRAGKAMEEIADLGVLESKVGGKAIDIAEELQNPILSGPHGILDMSSMEASEGIPVLARMFSEADNSQVLLKKFIAGAQTTARAKLPGMNEGFIEKASQMYSAEDSAMKFAYHLHLRQNGMNTLAAANEVARRLPMYNTIGARASNWRKLMLPWISFPMETARIMKNNIMDKPFTTMMWMHAPNLVQGGLAMPFGKSYEQVEALKQQNPMWAQKSSAIVTPFRDKNDQIRTMMMDLLPWMSISPQSEAKDADFLEKMPFGLGNPFPIVMGLVNAVTGKSSFGEDMPVDPNSSASKMEAAVLNTMGFLLPPIMQKYLTNASAPSTTYRLGQDAGVNVNPSTGVTGDWMFDLALANAPIGVKSYAGSPFTQIANERYGARKVDNYRGDLGRKFTAWTRSGNWDNAGDVLRSVYHSYLTETPDNPGLAYQRYTDWMQEHSRDLAKNPGMKGISRDQFLRKLRETGNSVAPVLNEARKDYHQALVTGYYQTAGSRSKSRNVLTRGVQRSSGRTLGRK